MDDFAGVLLLLFGLVTGIRHGIDIDHIAAITDMTSSQTSRTRGILLATLYAGGHGVMVIGLGILLIMIGQQVPEPLDRLFGKLVGATLIVLGVYVLYSLFRYGSHFRMKSRWMLIFDAIQVGYHKLLHNFSLDHRHPRLKEEKYGIKAAFGIGIIHGIGAETPTQISALATLLGIGGGIRGILFLLCFVIGIFLSNLGIALFSLAGFAKLREKSGLYIAVGVLTSVFSIVVGGLFLV